MDRSFKNLFTTLLLVGALVAAFSSVIFAQSSGSPPQKSATGAGMSPMRMNSGSGSQSLSSQDKAWLSGTQQSNIAEIQLYPTVEQNAKNTDYNRFAQTIRTDHSNASKNLSSLAGKLNYSLPTTPSQEDMDMAKKLSQLHGAQFDQAYKQMMIKDHTENIAKTRTEISRGQNPQVKAAAKQTLTVLQKHLGLAKALPSNVAASRTASSKM